jgi:hypothetical protein
MRSPRRRSRKPCRIQWMWSGPILDGAAQRSRERKMLGARACPARAGGPRSASTREVACADAVQRQILRQGKPRRPLNSPSSPRSGAGSAIGSCGRPEVSFHLGATDSLAGLNPSDQKTQTCDLPL